MKFTSKLTNMSACEEAVIWVGSRGLVKAWRECPRGDWMLWLAGKLEIDRKLLVLAACDCAETALKFVPDGEDRPAKAIQTSRNWCGGTATIKDYRDAAYAAAYAAYAAAYAAYAAADAGNAAAYAAYAGKEAHQTCADLVRKRIPLEIIKEAMK